VYFLQKLIIARKVEKFVHWLKTLISIKFFDISFHIFHSEESLSCCKVYCTLENMVCQSVAWWSFQYLFPILMINILSVVNDLACLLTSNFFI
jgi:hypothetical protein